MANVEFLFQEAVNYDDMFSGVIQFLPDELQKKYTAMYKDLISMYKEKLIKSDRVIWFLRLKKRGYLDLVYKDTVSYYDKRDLPKEEVDEKLKALKSYIDKQQKKLPPSVNTASILTKVEHFISLDIDDINDYAWKNQTPDEILSYFEKIEDLYKDRNEYIPVQEDDDIILEIGDYYWVRLNKAYCQKEGAAMGHCGNSPRKHMGDDIYSLRMIKEFGTKKYWHPFITVTLDDELMVWEVKGRDNEKPDTKFIPYLVELFKDDEYVRGQRLGVGYLPENNLTFQDFSDEQQQQVYRSNHNFELEEKEPLVIALDEEGIIDDYNGNLEVYRYANRDMDDEDYENYWEYVTFDYSNYKLLDTILDYAKNGYIGTNVIDDLIDFYITHDEGGGQEDAEKQVKDVVEEFNSECLSEMIGYVADDIKTDEEDEEKYEDKTPREILSIFNTPSNYDEVIEYIDNNIDEVYKYFGADYVDTLEKFAVHYKIEIYSSEKPEFYYKKIFIDNIDDEEIDDAYQASKQRSFKFESKRPKWNKLI